MTEGDAGTLSSSDKKILRVLQVEGDISNVALAEKIGMSPSPCLRRVKQLEQDGIIGHYAAILDRRKIDLGLVVYVEGMIPQIPNVDIISKFRKAVLDEPSIIGCYVTAGRSDFMLKVVARDMESYAALVQDVLLRLPGVQQLQSNFELEAIKDTTILPID